MQHLLKVLVLLLFTSSLAAQQDRLDQKWSPSDSSYQQRMQEYGFRIYNPQWCRCVPIPRDTTLPKDYSPYPYAAPSKPIQLNEDKEALLRFYRRRDSLEVWRREVL